MASTTIRLTNAIRDDIVDKAMKQRFSAEVKALQELRASTAIKLYELRYPENERKLMAKLPEHWLKKENGISVTTGGGERDYLSFSGDLAWSGIGRELRMLVKSPNDIKRDFPNSEATCKLDAEGMALYRVWIAANKKLSDEHYKAKTTLQSYLQGFSTCQKLAEAWPECKPWLPRAQADLMKINLPAIAPATLNELLGLKPAA